MKINNFFGKLTSKQEEKKENFLALELAAETVKTASWRVEGEGIKVLRLGSIQEWETQEDLLKAVDLSITSASEGISPEPEKVILGLPHSWVEEDSILPKKKAVLAKLCEELKLKPVGFVVSQEALVSFLKQQQGTPVSAILVRLGETEAIVSLVTLGKIIGTENVGRSQDLALDIKEGLARFKGIESFPSRIILFDGLSDFEEAKQQIISFDWLANLPFLHFPKVESLERDFVMKAIAIAGGAEVAKSLGLAVGQEQKTEFLPQKVKKEDSEGKEEKQTEINLDDLGFVENEDIKEIEPKTEKIEKKINEKETNKEQKIEKKYFSQSENKKLNNFFNNFFSHLSMPHFFHFSGKKGLMLGIFFVILAIFGFAFWFWLRAKVVLYFKSQDLTKEVTFTLDTKASVLDQENKTIPAQELTIESKGEDQADATGEKLIGEKAKGEVTIYNKTSLVKNFVSGTILVGEDNLKFILDEEVKVASSSSQEQSDQTIITTPGKTKAKISAASVGEESNLGPNSNFTFKDYPVSNFSAKNEEELTGGSSKKVKVITAQDRDQLLEKLTKQLEEKGKEELKNKLSTEKTVLDKTLTSKVIKKDFDKKVDEEGQKVKLTLQLSIITLEFNKQDLQLLLKKELAADYPADFVTKGDIESEIINTKTQDDKTKVKVTVMAKTNLIPSTDEEKLKNQLKGKSAQEAKNYLLTLSNLLRAKIDIYPWILGKIQILPFRSQNIGIEVMTE